MMPDDLAAQFVTRIFLSTILVLISQSLVIGAEAAVSASHPELLQHGEW